jgi:hypothetical protein
VPKLPDHKSDRADDTDEQADDGAGRRPALLGAFVEEEDESGHGDEGRQGADHVERVL